MELLWDLVFVFAVTQVSALLYSRTTWPRFGEAVLVLALVWWAWSAFVWVANAHEADSPTLRHGLLLATVFIFIAGLAVPRAFSSESLLFAGAYAAVRLLHLALYADASRRGHASLSAIAGFAVTVLIGMALLVVGALVGGRGRTASWVLALAIDYAGPAWLTRARLRGLQRVAVAHFAERYSLFVIICLGESIVAIGAGATHQGLDGPLVAAVSAGLLCTVALWWTYFARYAATAERRLRDHPDPVLAAADAYSYLHLAIVAGIIIFAVGMRFVVRDASAPVPAAGRVALCGGIALYLLGQTAFRLRMSGERHPEAVGAAALAGAVTAAGAGLDGWAFTAVLAAVLCVMCAVEDAMDRRSRGR